MIIIMVVNYDVCCSVDVIIVFVGFFVLFDSYGGGYDLCNLLV